MSADCRELGKFTKAANLATDKPARCAGHLGKHLWGVQASGLP